MMWKHLHPGYFINGSNESAVYDYTLYYALLSRKNEVI